MVDLILQFVLNLILVFFNIFFHLLGFSHTPPHVSTTRAIWLRAQNKKFVFDHDFFILDDRIMGIASDSFDFV